MSTEDDNEYEEEEDYEEQPAGPSFLATFGANISAWFKRRLPQDSAQWLALMKHLGLFAFGVYIISNAKEYHEYTVEALKLPEEQNGPGPNGPGAPPGETGAPQPEPQM